MKAFNGVLIRFERKTAVSKTVSRLNVVTTDEVESRRLPAPVARSLGDLAGAARDGLLALSVEVGIRVLGRLLEEEVASLCGPRGKHDSKRRFKRHGRTAKAVVTLGGRRTRITRPRVRDLAEGRDVLLETYRYFAAKERLKDVVVERMLVGVSTRKYRRCSEPVGQGIQDAEISTSKSSISRAFIDRTRYALSELLSRRLDDVRLAALMIDGIHLGSRTHVVALGITTSGVKLALGLWEGSTENTTIARTLLADLVSRGLDVDQGVLCVIDGSKALRKAVREVLGDQTPVQRCVIHKQRNVLDHLPKKDQQKVKRQLQLAWNDESHSNARLRLLRLAKQLERTYPCAAASLREGLEETLTLTRLGITGPLKKTLCSTNPIESMISGVKRTSRNVKRWRHGDMAQRWTAMGLIEAEQTFKRINGYKQLANLATAIEKHQHTPEINYTLKQHEYSLPTAA